MRIVENSTRKWLCIVKASIGHRKTPGRYVFILRWLKKVWDWTRMSSRASQVGFSSKTSKSRPQFHQFLLPKTMPAAWLTSSANTCRYYKPNDVRTAHDSDRHCHVIAARCCGRNRSRYINVCKNSEKPKIVKRMWQQHFQLHFYTIRGRWNLFYISESTEWLNNWWGGYLGSDNTRLIGKFLTGSSFSFFISLFSMKYKLINNIITLVGHSGPPTVQVSDPLFLEMEG